MAMYILALDYGPDLINDVANQYINAINSGFGLIKGDVTWLLNVLIILSIMWSAALWALSDDHVIAQFARKIVYIGFFAWIIQNWQTLTDKLARRSWIWASRPADSTARTTTPRSRGTSPTWVTRRRSRCMDQIARLTGPVAFFKNIRRDRVPVPRRCRHRRRVLRHHHSGRGRAVDVQVRQPGRIRAGAVCRPVQNGVHRRAAFGLGGRLGRAADGADPRAGRRQQHLSSA